MKHIGKNWLIVVRAAASIAGDVALTTVCLIALTLSANARGSHESERTLAPNGIHGAQFADGRRHGNDPHLKAAIEERDRLLTTQLKSICRGC
jgi:hypothetical protein